MIKVRGEKDKTRYARKMRNHELVREERTRQDKTAPYRHVRYENGKFVPAEYESHELVTDKYDRETSRGFKRGKYEKRYGRMKPSGAYVPDQKDYRGFRKLKQEEIDAIHLRQAKERALEKLKQRLAEME